MSLLTTIKALLAKPILATADKERIISLVESINSVDSLSSETRALLPSLKGGAMFDTLVNDRIVLSIPSFYRSTGTVKGTDLVEKHSITFKLASYDVQSVRLFSIALDKLQSRAETVPWADDLYLSRLVDNAIPVLKGIAATPASAATTAKTYESICKELGLSILFPLATEWTNHSANNAKYGTAITAIVDVAKADDFEEHLTALKDAGVFLFENEGKRYTVKSTDIVEKRKVTSVSYRINLVKGA
jgi:hypothetical protein